MTSLTLATQKHVPAAVMVALSKSAIVRAAHFEMTQWNDDDCERLRRSGEPPGSLTALHLTRNRITSAGVAALSYWLERGEGLRTVNLSSNPLGVGLAPLGRAAPERLEALNLNETQAPGSGAEGLVAVADALAERRVATGRVLRTLHLHGNHVDDDAAARLAPALGAAGVREVFLGKNRIGDVGGRAFAEYAALPLGPRKLSLISNHLGDGAATAFGAALHANAGLELLNLSHNDVGDAGLAALLAGVRRNAHLRKLDVGVNARCSDGAKRALREAFGRDALAARRARLFVAAATQVLLAHVARRRDDAEEAAAPLAGLPHGVLVFILDFARPESFRRLDGELGRS